MYQLQQNVRTITVNALIFCTTGSNKTNFFFPCKSDRARGCQRALVPAVVTGDTPHVLHFSRSRFGFTWYTPRWQQLQHISTNSAATGLIRLLIEHLYIIRTCTGRWQRRQRIRRVIAGQRHQNPGSCPTSRTKLTT